MTEAEDGVSTSKVHTMLDKQANTEFIASTVKLADPPIKPFLIPLDYSETLADIYEELETASEHEKGRLYMEQSFVFRGLGDRKLLRRSLQSAQLNSVTEFEMLVYAAWLTYEKRSETFQALSTSHVQDFSCLSLSPRTSSFSGTALSLEASNVLSCASADELNAESYSRVTMQEDAFVVYFGEEKVNCSKKKIAALSPNLANLLNECSSGTQTSIIDLLQCPVSLGGMRAIDEFSRKGMFSQNPSVKTSLEVLAFANKFACQKLKSTCDKNLAALVSDIPDALILFVLGLEESAQSLVVSCLRVFLRELPKSLQNQQIASLFSTAEVRKKLTNVGPACFPLYSLLSQVAMEEDMCSNLSVVLLERLKECPTSCRQRQMVQHLLGSVMLARKQYSEAQFSFEAAAKEGHTYSQLGVARAKCRRGQKRLAYIDLTALINAYKPRGWMYQERALCCDDAEKLADLDKATEMDPSLPYPYKFRAAMLMDQHEGQLAVSEINRLLAFKVTADCLELRALFNLYLEDFKEAVKDIRALLSLKPSYRLFAGCVSANRLLSFLEGQVTEMSKTDCWRQLQECCSSLDDIGALAVIHKVLESDPGRGSLFFWQSLFLLRLNCPKEALYSLHLASKNASSDHERSIYEGWICYHTNRREDAIWKAEKSIESQPTFEAYLLKATSLADTSLDQASSKKIVELLKEALKYPSHGLRKGQAFNHLGNILLDSGNPEPAAECYRNAVALGHTLAHQGLAEVYSLQGQRKSAHQEMTKLIQKARSKASAYEKRSEYAEVEEAIDDLSCATKLNPLRPFPYKFRAAVLMDKERHSEAMEELSKVLSFKPDAQLLHLRAAINEFLGDESHSLQDCCASLSLDSSHADTLRLYAHLRSQQVH